MDTEIYAYIAESAKMTSADLSELHNFAIYYGDDVILNLKITLRYFLINNILYSEDKQSQVTSEGGGGEIQGTKTVNKTTNDKYILISMNFYTI